MKEQEETPVCPSCGAPRLGHAWDCVQCGAVFDDAFSSLEADDVRPPSAAPPAQAQAQAAQPTDAPAKATDTHSTRRPSSSARPSVTASTARGMTRRRATPMWLRTFRTWIEENTGAAVAFAIMLHLAVAAFAATVIASSTNDTRRVDKDYRMIVGAPLPEAFLPVVSGRFVGRRFVVLQHFGGQATVIVVAEGWIAGRSTPEERMQFVEGFIDLIELPWKEVGTRNGEIGPQPVQVRILEVGPKEAVNSLYLAPFTAPNKDSCIFALMGPVPELPEIQKGVFGEY